MKSRRTEENGRLMKFHRENKHIFNYKEETGRFWFEFETKNVALPTLKTDYVFFQSRWMFLVRVLKKRQSHRQVIKVLS